MAIDLVQIQNTIGYEFENEDLLQQAFVRRSYSEEKGGQNNEVLEFIGDKALDFAVIRIMMERFGEITESKQYQEFKLRNPKYFKTKKNEGQFTDIKKDLVNKKALAYNMDVLGFNSQLILGEGDIKNSIWEKDSVKEDLFEAIIGAVALDSNWDMDIITEVVATMIDFEAYFEHEEDENYVGLVQEWAQQNDYELPNYEYYDNDEIGYDCCITIGDIIEEIEGNGMSKAKARMDAAYNAYCYLVDNGYILNEFIEAVGEPNEEQALRQMNELVQKSLISKPKYIFTQKFDVAGNPVWTCECEVEENENVYECTASTKKDAQKHAAYEMLLDLMGMYEEC